MPKTASKRKTDSNLQGASPRQLIATLLDYEAAAKRSGVDFTAGNFNSSTNEERDNIRAELIADYLHLCVSANANHDETLAVFCTKICNLEMPSHELMGTYLAAVNIAFEEGMIERNPTLPENMRAAIISALQQCCEHMASRNASKRNSQTTFQAKPVAA